MFLLLGLITIDVSSTVAYAIRGEGIGSVPWLLGVAEPYVAAEGGAAVCRVRLRTALFCGRGCSPRGTEMPFPREPAATASRQTSARGVLL